MDEGLAMKPGLGFPYSTLIYTHRAVISQSTAAMRGSSTWQKGNSLLTKFDYWAMSTGPQQHGCKPWLHIVQYVSLLFNSSCRMAHHRPARAIVLTVDEQSD